MNAAHSPTRIQATRQALIVDDDKFMQQVLGDMLRELGVSQITTAVNGISGMKAFDRFAHMPDVVLCDLHMPDNDGFQFMEQLAERGYRGGVILVSGMDERVLNSATLMAKFHSLNILATLKKPVDESTLGDAGLEAP